MQKKFLICMLSIIMILSVIPAFAQRACDPIGADGFIIHMSDFSNGSEGIVGFKWCDQESFLFIEIEVNVTWREGFFTPDAAWISVGGSINGHFIFSYARLIQRNTSYTELFVIPRFPGIVGLENVQLVWNTSGLFVDEVDYKNSTIAITEGY